MKSFLLLTLLPAAPLVAGAQEVHADRTVTFRYQSNKAQAVTVSGDWGRGALVKDGAGVWTFTTPPLEPNIYSYKLSVDGQVVADPLNNRFKPERVGFSNAFEIAGDAPAPWDRQAGVAHGGVHLHEYDSKSLGTVRRLRVYTPPGYEAAKDRHFPVLYLFHGSGDNEATWTEFGRADLILDNLIAAGKARSMIVVMPNGHAMPPVPRDAPNAAEVRGKNLSAFERDLLEDVMPFVESQYRVETKADKRAIIGLSMGGSQSITVGLNHLDIFGWVGCMSSAVREPETQLAPFFSGGEAAKRKLRLLWIAVGKDDPVLAPSEQMNAKLTEKQVKHTFVRTPGAHAWPVWRRHLAEFVTLVFEE